MLRNEPRRRPEDTCRRLLDHIGLAASQPANQTARRPETLRRRPETLAGVRKPPGLKQNLVNYDKMKTWGFKRPSN